MVTRWGELERVLTWLHDRRQSLDRMLMDAIVGPFDTGAAPQSMYKAGAWPRTNLYETPSEIVVRAEVPGLEQDSLSIDAHEELLTLSGERKLIAPEGYITHRHERADVSFRRSFKLPCRIDLERTSATLKNGMLTVRMAKSPEAQPRRITVRSQ